MRYAYFDDDGKPHGTYAARQDFPHLTEVEADEHDVSGKRMDRGVMRDATVVEVAAEETKEKRDVVVERLKNDPVLVAVLKATGTTVKDVLREL